MNSILMYILLMTIPNKKVRLFKIQIIQKIILGVAMKSNHKGMILSRR